MTKDEALRLALEALKEDRAWLETDAPTEVWEKNNEAITAIKAALLSRSDGEAKDEKANDELRRLHDLLGKANALARIRANKIDELEQRLTKTEAQLGEAVWNYGELKREQLANQQKTSGSPINTSTALEAKDEPVAIKWEKDADKECRYNNWVGITPFGKILITWKGWKEYHDACVDEFPGGFEAYGLPDDVKAACEVEYLRRLYTTPPQRKPLTDEEITEIFSTTKGLDFYLNFARAIEAAHGIKVEA